MREISSISLHHDSSAPDLYEEETTLIPKNRRASVDSAASDAAKHQEVDEAGFPLDGHFTTKSQIRQYMSTYCQRPSEEDLQLHARYALKELKCTDDKKRLRQGLIDLSIEAQFLACLNHPNIIKMRALSGKPYETTFGIILDRLYMTLEDKMEFWKEEKKNALSKHFCGCLGMGLDKATKEGLMFQAITVAYDLSCAMKYIAGQK